ncbi:MAG: zinc-binding dehydrogenase [Rhodospirillaceae bacterium]|nr:zinc-binding dehydrogenase [Rhodospirillaceae bacterium]MBT7291673.1 zinc-binding dehydrogenase [Rhodospirillaceae bacterium]
MKAIAHQGEGLDGASYRDMDRPETGPGQVCVQLKAAALNHRDIWTCNRADPNGAPVILGSDGAGIVAELGAGVDDLKAGDEVVINSSQDWASQSEVPLGEYGVGYKILGFPDHGTFAEYIVIGRQQLEPKPAFLDWREAAAFCLVGLTTYRALFTEGRLKAGQTVAIPGIGGGAATQALLFAKAAGAKVVVTSRADEKLNKARELGADLAISSDGDWGQAVRDFTGGRGADIVIETIGGATWKNSMAALANGGRLAVFGATSDGMVEIDLASLFLHWQSIIGTTMGSREEFRDMLAFTEAHQIHPVIDRTFPLAEGVEAMRYLDNAGQMGNVVLDI